MKYIYLCEPMIVLQQSYFEKMTKKTKSQFNLKSYLGLINLLSYLTLDF